MRKRVGMVAILVATAMLAASAPAAAKGPSGATIEGPGIGEPIELDMTDERLWELADLSGFATMVYGGPDFAGATTTPPQTLDLGPVFTITFHHGDERIPLLYYPDSGATAGPDGDDSAVGALTHLPSITPAVGVDKAASKDGVGTWFAPDSRLDDLLTAIGVPTPAVSPPVAVTKPAPTTPPSTVAATSDVKPTPARDGDGIEGGAITAHPDEPFDRVIPAVAAVAIAGGAVVAALATTTRRRRRTLAS